MKHVYIFLEYMRLKTTLNIPKKTILQKQRIEKHCFNKENSSNTFFNGDHVFQLGERIQKND